MRHTISPFWCCDALLVSLYHQSPAKREIQPEVQPLAALMRL